MKINEILQLKYPDINFLTDIIIQDDSDGQGPYIKSWNLSGTTQPSQSDMDQWAIEYDLQYRQNQVRETRRSLYPSWEDQLDMQYHDGLNNTTVWQDTIEAIKVANPKPTE